MNEAAFRDISRRVLGRVVRPDPTPPYAVLKPEELTVLGFEAAAVYLAQWGYRDPGEEAVLRRTRGKR